MQPRSVTAFAPPATLAAAPSRSLPRAMASSCKTMSCEKCYVSKVRSWPFLFMCLSLLSILRDFLCGCTDAPGICVCALQKLV